MQKRLARLMLLVALANQSQADELTGTAWAIPLSTRLCTIRRTTMLRFRMIAEPCDAIEYADVPCLWLRYASQNCSCIQILYRSPHRYSPACLHSLSSSPALPLSASLRLIFHLNLLLILVSFQNSRGRQDVVSTIRGVLQGRLFSLILAYNEPQF